MTGKNTTSRRRPRWYRALTATLAVLAVLVAGGVLFANPTTGVADADGAQIVESGKTQWQYRDDNQQPADGWQTSAAVSDAAWKTASGSFGAKNGQIADLGGGMTPQVLLNQYINGADGDAIPVYYFRTTFDAKDIDAIQAITGEVAYDDAAIVAVNGHVVAEFDNHVKDGTDPIYGTTNYGGSNDSAPKTATFNFTDIASLGLKATGNVLSVELHNGRATSSDIYLDVKNVSFTYGKAADTVKDASLEIGATESARNFNWLGTSTNASFVEIAPAAGYKEGDAFPESGAEKVQALQSAATREGFMSNKATVSGLAANTAYVYRVGNDDAWSDPAVFTTGNFGSGASFSFLFAGDPQIGASGNSDADQAGWQATLTNAVNKLTPNFMVSAGDQINDKGAKEDGQYDSYFAPKELASLTQALTVGNHDNGSSRYSDYFNVPNVSSLGATSGTGTQSGDYWYVYNGVLFMDINSNDMNTGNHKAFMEQAIAANPNVNWKIVVFHHSVFSLANHYTDSDIQSRRNELPQVFSDLGIDVVLMGHDHYFTRTTMMEGANPVASETGADANQVVDPAKGQVLYLTADSASGSKYYKTNSAVVNAMPTWVAAQGQSNRPTITNVTVNGGKLTLDTYYTDSADLEKLDTFTIVHTDQNSGDNGTDNNGSDNNNGTGNNNGTDNGTGNNNGSDNNGANNGSNNGANNGNNNGTGNGTGNGTTTGNGAGATAKPSTSTGTKGGSLPQTGDLIAPAFIAAIVVVGVAVIAAALVLKNRDRQVR